MHLKTNWIAIACAFATALILQLNPQTLVMRYNPRNPEKLTIEFQGLRGATKQPTVTFELERQDLTPKPQHTGMIK